MPPKKSVVFQSKFCGRLNSNREPAMSPKIAPYIQRPLSLLALRAFYPSRAWSPAARCRRMSPQVVAKVSLGPPLP